MNILQVNTAADTGGAGVAMLRLHHALTAKGHDSHILARLRRSPQPDVLTIPEVLGLRQTSASRFSNNVRMQLDAWFALPRVYGSTQQILHSELFEYANVIQLHNLHGWYLNYELLPRMAARKPVIWTLHDMWAFTGHCAYSYGCVRWQKGCFNCRSFVATAVAWSSQDQPCWTAQLTNGRRSGTCTDVAGCTSSRLQRGWLIRCEEACLVTHSAFSASRMESTSLHSLPGPSPPRARPSASAAAQR